MALASGDLSVASATVPFMLPAKQLAADMFGHEFLFITDYDAKERAFYHMRDENGVPQGYDLIWRGVEITTGAQREHRYDVLKAQAEEIVTAELINS